jgi:hypothetical protein
MKTISVGTKEMLDRALELEYASVIYVMFVSGDERNVFYEDLLRRRLWLIRDEHLDKYESVVINKRSRGSGNGVSLTKMHVTSVCITKLDGSVEEATF